mmetsp:Transcript_22214/g.55014  ORF Transcript_22214/g.55014 Transcript_22214/m.55014 type:complete len:127 (+) Transcript_22214:1398-1778(+)
MAPVCMMIRPKELKTETTWTKKNTVPNKRRIEKVPTGSNIKKKDMKDIKKVYMLQTISRPGSSVAYCPIDDLSIQWAFPSSIALIMAVKVKVEMRLKIVDREEMIMNKPAQKLTVPQCASTKSSRT